jgi:SSS family solute:Na+ symporter/sodium/pantothenate symporter
MIPAISPLLAASASDKLNVGFGTLAALIVFILASMWIGMLANKAMSAGTFMKGFFLGNRGLGAWALALTATVQSGGTFMGFPSLVYTHGWAVALWICGYMVVPITGFGVLGKRMAQLSRKTGALTVPDMFRARFNSPALGLTASLFIMFYMSFMMVAQFKSGALVMKLAWPNSGTLALSEDAKAFQLTTDNLQKLDMPSDVKEKLAAIVDHAFDKEEIRTELATLLSQDEIKKYEKQILKAAQPIDWLFYIGLGIFTLTVVGYTLLGGFLAAVWTDLFQSVMMLVGVMLLLFLALSAVSKMSPTQLKSDRQLPGVVGISKSTVFDDNVLSPLASQAPVNNQDSHSAMENATLRAVEETGPGFAFGPGYDPEHEGREYLPLGLAFSFFWVWVYSGLASPAGMVRVMAGKSTEVIRKSIFLLSGYNALIYIPLVMICICGRALIPDLPPGQTDEIIPRLALETTKDLPLGSFIAGLILAAPFGAVMATVSSYLVVIASGLIRDVYQRFINPHAGTQTLRRLSYIAMITVGLIAVAANIKPVDYLQVIVVFSGTGAAATFCVAALMLAFWRRATVAGMICAMISGGGTVITLYLLGIQGYGAKTLIGPVSKFRPYFLLGVDPLLWGLAVSLVAGIMVSLFTTPPDAALVSKLFDAEPSEGERQSVTPASGVA